MIGAFVMDDVFDMVFNAKSPCSIGNDADEIKLEFSIVERFGDQAAGSSLFVQCDNCGIKSNCRSCVDLFTLDVIQLTRFLLDFVVDGPDVQYFAFFQLVDCSLSPAQNEGGGGGAAMDGFSFFNGFVNVFVERMIGISNDDENNGS